MDKNILEESAKDYQEKNHAMWTGKGMAKDLQNAFIAGAEWQSKQSPWININDRSVNMPNDKVCLLRLEDGSIVRDTEEWEDRKLLVTHWMSILEL